MIDNKTARDKQFDDNGGKSLEGLLFGLDPIFDIDTFLFIFNEQSWEMNVEQFLIEFGLNEKMEKTIINVKVPEPMSDEEKEKLTIRVKNNPILNEIAKIKGVNIEKLIQAFILTRYKTKLNQLSKESPFVFRMHRRIGLINGKMH